MEKSNLQERIDTLQDLIEAAHLVLLHLNQYRMQKYGRHTQGPIIGIEAIISPVYGLINWATREQLEQA